MILKSKAIFNAHCLLIESDDKFVKGHTCNPFLEKDKKSNVMLLSAEPSFKGMQSASGLLTSKELVTESHLPKRPAPAPPTKPKPRKVPMYLPSFKRVEDSPSDNDLVMSMEKRSCLVESYKKKTKLELQRSIKSLKDDNAMFTKLNQDLRRILTGLREEQTRLEVLMDRQR